MITIGLAFGLFCGAMGVVCIIQTAHEYFFPAPTDEERRRIGEYELMAGNRVIRRIK